MDFPTWYNIGYVGAEITIYSMGGGTVMYLLFPKPRRSGTLWVECVLAMMLIVALWLIGKSFEGLMHGFHGNTTANTDWAQATGALVTCRD